MSKSNPTGNDEEPASLAVRADASGPACPARQSGAAPGGKALGAKHWKALGSGLPFPLSLNCRSQLLLRRYQPNPGKLSFGSSGNGSAAHLTTELWKAQTQTFMTHIPYRGAVPALTDLLGGQIQLFFDAPTGLINQGKSGKVRLIGVASERRLPAVPDVPTFIEQGFAGFTGSTWAGMLAPAGTPREIVKRMSDELARIVKSDETKVKLDAMGSFPAGGTPEEFDAFIASETTKWGRVIRTAGVKAE